MGLVLETLLFTKTNLTGSPTYDVLTPQGNDTAVVRDYEPGSRAYIQDIWGADAEHTGFLSIASPRMNDNTLGLLMAVPSGAETGLNAEEPQVLFPGPAVIPVYNADTLRVRATGTANDDVAFAFTIRYENLAGSDVKLQSWGSILPRITKTFGIQVAVTNGGGTYGTPAALNSTDDRLEAGESYALLGATCAVPTTLISIEGPDTGRYNIGMPGKTDPITGADWFVQLDEKYHVPSIPVIKALNAGNTLVTTADIAAAAANEVTLFLAQLG
jgi:hypothetical protein